MINLHRLKVLTIGMEQYMADIAPPAPVNATILQRLNAQMPLPTGDWNFSTTIDHLDSLSTLRLLLTLNDELGTDFGEAIPALEDHTTIGDLITAMSKSPL